MSAGFQLSLPGFDGRVDELPAVISSRQLTLDEIPLASIPSQFLAAAAGGAVDLELAGEVLSATARLVLLKSVHLLAQPLREDDEEPAPDVRERDPALLAPALALAERQGRTSYPSAGRAGSIPRLTETWSVVGLTDAWRSLLTREVDGRARASLPPFVRLETAISRIISRLASAAEISFRRVTGRASREDTVMHFLAALELVRRGEVEARQDKLFGDIHLGRSGDKQKRADRAG